MYTAYSVRVIDGVKHREFLGVSSSEAEARHRAKCATLCTAAYAYVRGPNGGAIVFLAPPDPNVFYGRGAPHVEKCRFLSLPP